MIASNREYTAAGYHGRVYVSASDPADDPQITVVDGDRWQSPGSLSPYLRFQGGWYAEWLYGPLDTRPLSGVPGQKFVEMGSNGAWGSMYIIPPGGTAWVLFMPQHALDPARGVHTGKLHIENVFYHVPQEVSHRRVMMLAVHMASRNVTVA